MHKEITCPYCRIGFGGYKVNNDVITHLDLFWSYESGLTKDCLQQENKQFITFIDDRGNPTFTEEFQSKLDELTNKFNTNPDDIDKTSFTYEAYFIAFIQCMNYGYVEGDDEEYDRTNMTGDKIKSLYESGVNLKDCLKSFIIKSNA